MKTITKIKSKFFIVLAFLSNFMYAQDYNFDDDQGQADAKRFFEQEPGLTILNIIFTLIAVMAVIFIAWSIGKTIMKINKDNQQDDADGSQRKKMLLEEITRITITALLGFGGAAFLTFLLSLL